MKDLKLIWIGSLAIKLLLAAIIPLTTDEAYYWVWSQRPQLSYFDHPPFVSWLFSLGHILESIGHAVRWPGVVLGHCTLLVWYFIWKYFRAESQSEDRYHWWLGLALCSPLLGFGSLVITPDLPVLFFWSTSLLLTLRILRYQRTTDYALFGASLGLGFCAKYHIVLFVLFLFAYLVFEKKWKEIHWKKAALTVLLGFIFSSPVLIWNYQNDFQSFQFQLKHGFSRPEYKFYWTWTYVLAQIMVLFPPVVYFALKAKLQGLARVLYYFGWGPLLFFFLSSFKALVEVNWPIVAYTAFFALAALGAKKNRPFLVTNIFWVVLFSILLSHAIKPWIPSAEEKLAEFSQFQPILEKRKSYEPLFASTYQMASWVWYESKTPFFKLKGMSRHDIFDTYPEGVPVQYPIYIAMKKHTPLPEWMLEEKSYKVTEIESLENDFVIVKVSR